MNVACDYEAPMQMLTTEKYIAGGNGCLKDMCNFVWVLRFFFFFCFVLFFFFFEGGQFLKYIS